MTNKETVERPKGQWIDFKCSECDHITMQTNFNFCPWCGADMRKEEGEEE